MTSTLQSSFGFGIIRSLSSANSQIRRSLERLSSGKRILSAADGSADSAMIQRLNSDIRGVRQAVLNVNKGTSLTQTADSGLNALLTIAYNLRELAQQASDSSLTTTERELLSEEADGLIDDFNLIVSDVKYNNQSLLDNSFNHERLQIGVNSDSSFYFSIGDARASTLGKLALYSGTQGAISTSISGQVVINGTTITSSLSDGVSSRGAAYSGLAIATAINNQSGTTGVFAEAVVNTRTLTTDFAGAALYSGTFEAGEFQINDVAITGTIASASALVTSINAASSETGVTATLDGTDVTLSTSDGRNIEIYFSLAATNNVYDVFNLSTNYGVLSNYATLSSGNNSTHVGAIRLWSSEAITISGTSVSSAIGLSSGTYDLVSGTQLASISLEDEDEVDLAIKTLDATIAQISSLRSNIGAVHDRLDMSQNYLLESELALSDAKSALEDVDFILETTNLVKAQLLQDSALSALTQANVSRSKVYKLLEEL